MGLGRIGMFSNMAKVAGKTFEEGSHIKIFKDGTVARLVDYVENGAKKSRLTIFPKAGYQPTVIDRLTTRARQAGHTSTTKHIVNQNLGLGESFVGEAYAEGGYRTIDRFYTPKGDLKYKITGFTTPSYEKKYGCNYDFKIKGAPQKDVPFYLQWGQYADMNTDGTLRSLKETISGDGRSINIPITENIRDEYSILTDIAKKPLNLLNRTY